MGADAGLVVRAAVVRAVVVRGQLAAPGQAFTQAWGWFALAGYQGLALAAVAGLDMALRDALAQAAGLPLARLLGGTLEPVPAYNSNGLGGTAAPTIWRRSAGSGPWSATGSPWPPTTTRGLALGDALERCRALGTEGLTWIEEPLRYDDLDGHARIARDITTPVILGENFYGVMPDLMRIGGVTGWLQAAAADVAGLPVSSHLYPEVSGHLMSVTPTRHRLEWQDWADQVLAHPFEVRDGTLLVPDVPGNGLAWDEDAVTHSRSSN